jgi:hypothetical protein
MIARNPRHPRHRRRRSDAAQVPDNITSNNLHLLDKYEPVALTPDIAKLLIEADILTAEEEGRELLAPDANGEVVVTAGVLRRLIDRLMSTP